MTHQENGNGEKQPGDELERRKWIPKPLGSIEQDKSQDRLPGEESIEAMRVRAKQRSSGNIDKKN